MLDPAQARTLAARLRKLVPTTERRRQLPRRSVEALRRQGVFRALVPVGHGGLESELAPLFEFVLELAAGCPATAWVGSLFAVHSLIVAWFPPGAQQRVWARGPDARVGSSLAPMGRARPVEGGLGLEGRWSFSSGVDHADWLLLGVPDGLVLVPRSVARVEDDWHVAGLAGSGSKSLTLEGVVVPEDCFLPKERLEKGLRPHTGRLYQVPWRPLFSYTFVPPMIGAARHCLEVAREHFQQRRSAFTGQAYRERGPAWIALARAQGEVDTALALMRRDLADNFADHARSAYTPALIARLCRDAVTRLFEAGGATALYADHPLQRLWRDVQAMGQHPALHFDSAAEIYGRSLLCES